MLKPGDVATAFFAFADQSGAKRRPVLVVSSDEYNTITGNVIIAAISSKPPKNRFEYPIKSWDRSGLKMPSKIRAGTLQTSTRLILQKIGSLPQEEIFTVKHLLEEVLNLQNN